MRSVHVVTLLLIIINIVFAAVIPRDKRQTYKYDDELKSYAHPHPGTIVSQGYLARYDPQDWPKWYSRNIMQWDAISRLTPGDVPSKWGTGRK
ncbi:unnamed protein product [Auanema sp. JU1783]|nr:unnamed protein product [Auanema sp. JU1783]